MFVFRKATTSKIAVPQRNKDDILTNTYSRVEIANFNPQH